MGALDEPRRLWDGKRGAARQGGVDDLSSRPLTRPVDAEATRSDTATRAIHRSGWGAKASKPSKLSPLLTITANLRVLWQVAGLATEKATSRPRLATGPIV